MGEVFAGRYELVDPIGRGGVGAVWRAWDHRRRRYVAAKVLQQSDAHALLRFVREQALRIDHPHVLAPASWAADDDKVLFTMDLVAGGSLVHLVNDYGPLPPDFVLTLLDQLLAGLAAVHAEGVVHRDVKPANVLLEATGTGRPRLRLSDFGIAMRLGEPRLTETDYVVGTPGYLAPEQLLGSEPDFPADLFAAGLVALYLLEGAKPDAKALIEYFAEHGTPPAPRGIPEPLWQVVAALLQPDPDARFRTATGARKALAAAAELLPAPAPTTSWSRCSTNSARCPGLRPGGPLKRAPAVDTGSHRPGPPTRHRASKRMARPRHRFVVRLSAGVGRPAPTGRPHFGGRTLRSPGPLPLPRGPPPPRTQRPRSADLHVRDRQLPPAPAQAHHDAARRPTTAIHNGIPHPHSCHRQPPDAQPQATAVPRAPRLGSATLSPAAAARSRLPPSPPPASLLRRPVAHPGPPRPPAPAPAHPYCSRTPLGPLRLRPCAGRTPGGTRRSTRRPAPRPGRPRRWRSRCWCWRWPASPWVSGR